MTSSPDPAEAARPRTPSPLSAPLRHLHVLAYSAIGLIALAVVLALAAGGDPSTKVDLMVWAAVTVTAGITCAVGAVVLAGIEEVARRLEQARRG
ncbi:hypothetical protein ACFQRL_07845 [Microbacterium fluvii]|uniref:Uncharacterized protein n=1 Tax=Microbacterium fluvii TaxID=415215 RepID=A0ABW2HGG6_9MICO|nr:hypothetical protein [Microbacterium fluvii]MCU4672497.1 hypothetical protein [Microbacterium fluvii]